jgi:23S rRNA pseudouridine2605 synthase
VPKTYHVTVAGVPAPAVLEQLRQGVELADGRTRPAQVQLLRQRPNAAVLEIVLTEGRNRQIRRMLATLGHRVRRLVRVAIGTYRLGDLPPGACRTLDADAVRQLENAEP